MKPGNVKPFGVYRGQVVVVEAMHERTAVVIDENDTHLLVALSEVRTDAASVTMAMAGYDD